MAQNPTITSVSESKPPYFWGIDIGGTGIKIGLVDDIGQTLSFETLPTRESEGATAAMQRVAAVVKDVEEQLGVSGQVRRIGLGSPGPMDLKRGYLVAPPQLPSWWDFPIRDTVSKLLGRPVTFLNDANAAAYGEFWLGTGKTDRSMLLLTLGTGVGGGIILEDELVNGVNSFGSECGHILVDPSPTAQLCVWGGGRGQLEAYASASAVVHRTRAKLTEGRQSLLSGHLHGHDSELTAKRVYEAAVEGDELALEIIHETARWLGIGITSIVHTIDPGSVVLGGAMNFGGKDSPIGQRFLKGISDEFQRRTFENVFAGTTIHFASLGADAGYLGVAGYARKESQSK
ncbi:Glucokinase [Rubripirellula tenax]|uniref:Glucokinase n=1 Tax=Rubripirellula tenax TaxID=2528015 RepID=A0A5C6EKF7_9BACT|nr:ROK family protein [Rubripirellula tenax]TWU48577.1 Glucokinase [Rubripirellula tenax]